jgi:uncharacterized protein YegP (UPF0339 family)
VALPRFTIFVAPERGRPGRPLRAEDLQATGIHLSWRLLAANNRDVARSALAYGALADCLDAVAELRERVGDAMAVSTRTGRADWSWRLRLDARDIAVSSRTYQRRLQCEAACSLFVVLVPLAAVEAAPSPDLAEKTSSTGP